MGRFNLVWSLSLCLCLIGLSNFASAQLRQNFYASTCPNVETLVRNAVRAKIQQTFVTIPGTLRLFFHDCFVQGCDASVMIQSSSGTAEKDHSDNQSLAGDGFDTVIKAKAAVDAVASCKNKVSCADILAIATRDVIALSGGPNYPVELGRLDGLSSTSSSVNGKLPKAGFNLNQLNSIFAANGLNQNDMIALSGGQSVKENSKGIKRMNDNKKGKMKNCKGKRTGEPHPHTAGAAPSAHLISSSLLYIRCMFHVFCTGNQLSNPNSSGCPTCLQLIKGDAQLLISAHQKFNHLLPSDRLPKRREGVTAQSPCPLQASCLAKLSLLAPAKSPCPSNP